MKILFALALTLFATGASAQSRQYYDGSGRSAGRSSTDSQGTTTFYDAGGRVTAKESKSGNSTTIYDASGRNVGRTTQPPR